MPNLAALAAFFSSKSVAAATPKRSALDFAFSASDSVFINGTALLESLCAMVSWGKCPTVVLPFGAKIGQTEDII